MFLTLCVIAYNEENTLGKILEDIKNQDYPHEKIEVVLVDGNSTDATKSIMEEFLKNEKSFKNILVLDNPKRTLPCGWNVALKAFSAEAILKVDAHARIPKDFVSKNVKVLESGEDIVGGQRPNVIDDESMWQETLLLAESSMFGSSIAPYRRNQGRKYVNSMFHAAYRRQVFEKIGGFNENLGRTEDNEIHYRMREAGFKLCFDPQIISYQHIRSSLKKMLKQKYSNGYWIALTTGVCPQCLSLYHFVPFLFVMAIILSSVMLCVLGMFENSVATVLFNIVKVLTSLMWSMYGILAVVMAILAELTAQKKQRNITGILLPVLFLLLHLSYGIGTVVGFFKLPKFLKQI